MKKLSEFVCDSTKVHCAKDMTALFEKYGQLFHDEEWDVPNVNVLRAQLGNLRAKASFKIIHARVASGELTPKPSRERGVAGNFIASVLNVDGEVVSSTETKRDNGKDVTVTSRLTCGFDSYQKAQKYLFKHLSVSAVGCTGVVESDKLPVKATYSREQAIAGTKKAK